MNYVCLIGGVLEFGANDVTEFAHYIQVYEKEIFDAEEQGLLVEMLSLNDEEYDEMFPVEDDET